MEINEAVQAVTHAALTRGGIWIAVVGGDFRRKSYATKHGHKVRRRVGCLFSTADVLPGATRVQAVRDGAEIELTSYIYEV